MINIDDRFIEKDMRKINGNSLKVLLAIAKHCNAEKKAFPGQERLKELSGLSRNTVKDAIKELVALNLLKKKDRTKTGKTLSPTYTINSDYISIFIPAKSLPLEVVEEVQSRGSKFDKVGGQNLTSRGSKFDKVGGQNLTSRGSKFDPEVLTSISINHNEVLTTEVLGGGGEKKQNLEIEDLKKNAAPPVAATPPKDPYLVLAEDHELAKRILEYLNRKANKSFTTDGMFRLYILDQIKAGFTEEDFKMVVDLKCKEWMGTARQQYLRPSTLFGDKFLSYLLYAKELANNPTISNDKKLSVCQLSPSWVEHYESITGNTYYFSKKSEQALMELEKKLGCAMRDKDPTISVTTENLSEALGHLLQRAVKDKWILENLDIFIINKQFNKIINPQFLKGKPQSFEERMAEGKAEAAEFFK